MLSRCTLSFPRSSVETHHPRRSASPAPDAERRKWWAPTHSVGTSVFCIYRTLPSPRPSPGGRGGRHLKRATARGGRGCACGWPRRRRRTPPWTGSNVSLRFSSQARAAAWQAMCECRMTSELATGRRARLDAVEEVADVLRGGEAARRCGVARQFAAERRRMHLDRRRCRPSRPSPRRPRTAPGRCPDSCDPAATGRRTGVCRQSRTSFTPLA